MYVVSAVFTSLSLRQATTAHVWQILFSMSSVEFILTKVPRGEERGTNNYPFTITMESLVTLLSVNSTTLEAWGDGKGFGGGDGIGAAAGPGRAKGGSSGEARRRPALHHRNCAHLFPLLFCQLPGSSPGLPRWARAAAPGGLSFPSPHPREPKGRRPLASTEAAPFPLGSLSSSPIGPHLPVPGAAPCAPPCCSQAPCMRKTPTARQSYQNTALQNRSQAPDRCLTGREQRLQHRYRR